MVFTETFFDGFHGERHFIQDHASSGPGELWGLDLRAVRREQQSSPDLTGINIRSLEAEGSGQALGFGVPEPTPNLNPKPQDLTPFASPFGSARQGAYLATGMRKTTAGGRAGLMTAWAV
jgi:hypothetical protein